MRALGAMLVVLAASMSACAAAAQQEPLIGGPCEGCELVFVGQRPALDPRARIAPADEAGERLLIEGRANRADGTPAAGAVVYAYQTDATGAYPRGATRHGRLRGWARTDARGAYAFETVRPGSYPGGAEPQHVHMHVIEPGRGTYYIDDLVFADDPLLTSAKRRGRPERGGSGLVQPVRDADGTWRVRRDVVLGHNVPGYDQP